MPGRQEARTPIIYVNDQFGDWTGDYRALVERCARQRSAAGDVARLLAPTDQPFILKPRHSSFYGTALEFLLEELAVNSLVLTGLSTDACVTMTAQDAHVRKFDIWVPRDCVAASSARISKMALAQIARVASANICPSTHGGWFAASRG